MPCRSMKPCSNERHAVVARNRPTSVFFVDERMLMPNDGMGANTIAGACSAEMDCRRLEGGDGFHAYRKLELLNRSRRDRGHDGHAAHVERHAGERPRRR